MMRSHSLFGFLLLICLLLAGMPGGANAQYPGFSDPGTGQVAGTGAGLVPVQSTIDGGTIPIGATGQVVVLFRNEGAQPVQTGVIQLYPSSTVSATVASNQCNSAELTPGADCAIALSVKGLQAGPWRVEMLMAHSGRSRLVTTTVSGTVEASGDSSDKLTTDVETIPDEVDFGSLTSSQTLVEPITLRNVTSVPIEISEVYIDAGLRSGYVLKAEDCKTLQAGQACIATVSWSPQMEGRSSGVLVVKHSGPAGISSVPLQGEYEPEDVDEAEIFPKAVPGKGLLVASQSEIDFGENVSTASAITVSLVNAGDAPVTLKDIRLSGSDNGLSFKTIGCATDLVLEPIEACPLTLLWSPTRVGEVFDDVQVVHDGARGVLVLPVRGVATGTVSQDQKAIDLSGPSGSAFESSAADSEIMQRQIEAARANRDLATAPSITDEMASGSVTLANASSASMPNPSSVLDGYKITSFSSSRAIINGPGGSRLVFDGEEIVIGGVPWFVVIQRNGIEFLHKGQRILLLFDRSLSSINRVSASSNNSSSSGSTSSSSANISDVTSDSDS